MKENKEYEGIICVCTGKKCKKKGSKEIFKAFRESIKGKNIDKSFLVIKTKCLDLCKIGPIVIQEGRLQTNFHVDQIKSN